MARASLEHVDARFRKVERAYSAQDMVQPDSPRDVDFANHVVAKTSKTRRLDYRLFRTDLAHRKIQLDIPFRRFGPIKRVTESGTRRQIELARRSSDLCLGDLAPTFKYNVLQ